MQFSRAARLIVVGLSAVGLAAAAVLPASADASSWKLGYYTPSPLGALSMSDAKPGGGIASFDFTDQSNTALLVTSHGAFKGTSLGDLAGTTITAAFTISGAAGPFTYFGEPDGCNTPASTRLFFQTDNGGGFQFTHYWWSNPVSQTLENGTFTLTATVEPTGWSDWNGQPGSTQTAGFADAASNVKTIGFSFGGGCFFENGVGTADGSGTFTLVSFNVN